MTNPESLENQETPESSENGEYSKLVSLFKSEISKLDEKISKLENPPIPQKSEEDESEKLSLKSLQNQLKKMQEEIAEKDKAILNSRRDEEIKNFFNKQGINYSDSAHKLFLAENQNFLQQESGSWYLKDGDDVVPLEESLKQFVERPDIAIYKKNFQKGSGLKPSQTKVGSSGAKSASLNDMIRESLSGSD